MPSVPLASANRPPPPTNTPAGPRVLIITDHTELGRALEHHVAVIWPEAECRVHAPLVSGRLHSAFTALGFDVVLLDDRVERGRGEEWLENLMHRAGFPPVIYLAPADEPQIGTRVTQRGAIEC